MKYSTSEINFLKINYKQKTDFEMAKTLKRKVQNIAWKRMQLGLKKPEKRGAPPSKDYSRTNLQHIANTATTLTEAMNMLGYKCYGGSDRYHVKLQFLKKNICPHFIFGQTKAIGQIRKDKYEKNNLSRTVKKSSSLSEVCVNLGIEYKHQHIQRLRINDIIDKHGIDSTHFERIYNE